MKILVLGGGSSAERDVSLKSATAVAEALYAAGYKVSQADPGQKGFLDNISPDTIVFPILHGAGGEDGVIQQELEKRGLPYLGTTSIPSAVCFDKSQTKAVYIANDLPVAQGATVTAETYTAHALRQKPHVLKVRRGGSSIGTYLVPDPKYADSAQVAAVFELGQEAFLEELVEGVEITVPVLDGDVLPVIEIQPPENQGFDYENKYNGATKEICPPVSIDAATQQQAQELAIKAHAVLGCRHLSRTDIIIRPSGSMVLLETNTMPGMTKHSLFPLAALVAKMDMPSLMKEFVGMVARDYNLKGAK